MTLRWHTTVIDCLDVKAQSRWWAEVLGWQIVVDKDDEVVVVPPHALTERARSVPPAERGPGLIFVPVPEGKTVKNRLHFDLAPLAGDDQEDEVRRLEDLGARRTDIGQGARTWIVMADPEGNEFCVLTPRD
jgi:catechol 2,3-dioxygenase-like lactoylglutathione lyase family enzyme